MIKSLLGEDEIGDGEKKTTPKISDEKENSALHSPAVSKEIEEKTETVLANSPNDEIESIDEIKSAIITGNIAEKRTNDIDQLQKDTSDSETGIITTDSNSSEEIILEKPSSKAIELEKKLREIEEELQKEKELESLRTKKDLAENADNEVKSNPNLEKTDNFKKGENQGQQNLFEDNWDRENSQRKEADKAMPQIQTDFLPETKAEGFRKIGMAWSAVIAFVGSILFMVVLGWGADLLLGTNPWGIVGGVVLGAVIGFVQLFRTTSQIFKPKTGDFDKVSLKSNIDKVEPKKDEEKNNAKSEASLAEVEAKSLDNEVDKADLDKEKKATTAENTDS